MHRISDEQYDTPQVPDIDHMWVILSSQSRCCYRHSLLDRWALLSIVSIVIVLLWALLLFIDILFWIGEPLLSNNVDVIDVQIKLVLNTATKLLRATETWKH